MPRQGTLQKSVTMLEREVEFGKPLEEVVVDLYEEHRTLDGVAYAMTISRNTLWLWLKLMGMDFRALRLAVLERAKRDA